MLCPACRAENDETAEACFTCGKALHALTQGIVLAGRYEILRPLGRGGMGRVYKARDRVLDEEVAIKTLRSEYTREPEMARRFRSEIKLARKVSHRNVCRIHEYGEDDGLAFICMEYIEGVTLKDFLGGRRLEPAEAFKVALQVAEGLHAVHEHGIIHRDFKASNIMIDGKGVVRLMDFGIAKQASGETGSTGSGVVGTPEYMSPEQASGRRLDLRSDVYSLGCVVFELFTGRAPFQGDTPLNTMYRHIHEPPPLDSPGIPAPLRPLLQRALAKEPEHRFGSAREVAHGLREARGALGLLGDDARPVELGLPDAGGGAPQPTTTLAPARGRTQRRRHVQAAAWPWLLAMLALAGVALALWTGFWPAPAGPPATPAASRVGAAVTLAVPPASTPTVSVPPSRSGEAGPRSLAPGPEAARPASRAPTTAAISSAPSLSAAVPSTASPRPEAAAAPETGTLSLLVVPESEVTIDGASLGSVSRREVALTPGRHVVRILHRDYLPLQRKVTINSGIETRLVLDLAEKGIRRDP